MNPFDDTRPSEPPEPPRKRTPAGDDELEPLPALASFDGRLIEDLARQLLADRRRERRWRLIVRLAWLLLAGALLWGLLRQQPAGVASGPHTALVELRGEIAADAEANAEGLNAALREAFADAGAQAIVLRINSPGGSPVQAGLIHDELQRLKALHGKKVYAVCEELCASAAYYVAVGADEIYVDKASIVGSIGVLMDGFGFTGTMDKLGVERRLLTTGDNKGLLDPFSPLSESHRAYAQSMIDQIHRQFVKVVRDGRGPRLKESAETFSGLFWSGEQSIREGLADRYGSLDYVAREVVKAEEVIDYTPKENVAERLAKRFGAAVGAGAARALGGAAFGLR